MPRPLKNNEINEKLSALESKFKTQELQFETQKKINFVLGFLYIVLFGLILL